MSPERICELYPQAVMQCRRGGIALYRLICLIVNDLHAAGQDVDDAALAVTARMAVSRGS